MKSAKTILALAIGLTAATFGTASVANENWAGPYVGVTLGATNYSMDAHDGDQWLTEGNLTANKLGAVRPTSWGQ